MARSAVGASVSARPGRITHVPVVFTDQQPEITDAALSELARAFWAKSGRTRPDVWLSLPQHLMDAADVAGLLFDHYASEHHRMILASVWEGDRVKARAALCFLAGVHDCGKASLAFTCQVPTLAQLVRDQGLNVPHWRDLPGRSVLPHSLVSYFALVDAITEGRGNTHRAREWAAVVGVHHGRYPGSGPLGEAQSAYSGGAEVRSGDSRWREVRREIIAWMAKRTGFPLASSEPTELPKLPVAVASAYASLVVVADWLASNEHFFPLLSLEKNSLPGAMSPEGQARRVEAAWRAADMPGAMRIPMDEGKDIGARYRHRFSWSDDVTPTAAQIGAVRIAEAEDPDFMIVEAPPGSGKTELAFSVTEVLLRKRGLQGVMIALPTQATTDAMFERARGWLDGILGDEPQKLGLFLAHGKNELNAEFLHLLEGNHDLIEVSDDDLPREVGTRGRTSSGLVANRWMTSRWRSTLSPVVVGTIDQVLLAALRSRHVLMRHLGLMGKAVIIDEVHAADSYMETYLESALIWLGMYRVPVILLSATLPSSRRCALVAAYRRGRDHVETDGAEVGGNIGYPAITTLGSTGGPANVAVLPGGGEQPPKTIRPLVVSDEDEIGDYLVERLAEGGCALVVRNTVDDAQRTFDAVLKRFAPEETSLLHSRFLASDRGERDARMLRLFGKDSSKRPERHIVVATQVIEQSLDVDFDIVLTDPAPMDLVLQRIGRLHRHGGRLRPAPLREAECHVLLKTKDSEPWEYPGGTRRIYGEHRILRMLAMLSDAGGICLTRTEDYADLTQLAYSDAPVGPATWQEAMAAASREAESDENTATAKARVWSLGSPNMHLWSGAELLTQFAGDQPTGEEAGPGARVKARAAVRDSEDQIPVIIIPIDPSLGGVAVTPPWTWKDDEPAIIDTSVWPGQELVRSIRSWSVSLPPWKFAEGREELDTVIDAVARAIWDDERIRGWKLLDHPLLRGELVLPMSKVDEFSDRLEAVVRGRKLVYTNQRGLEVQNL